MNLTPKAEHIGVIRHTRLERPVCSFIYVHNTENRSVIQLVIPSIVHFTFLKNIVLISKLWPGGCASYTGHFLMTYIFNYCLLYNYKDLQTAAVPHGHAYVTQTAVNLFDYII